MFGRTHEPSGFTGTDRFSTLTVQFSFSPCACCCAGARGAPATIKSASAAARKAADEANFISILLQRNGRSCQFCLNLFDEHLQAGNSIDTLTIDEHNRTSVNASSCAVFKICLDARRVSM